MKPVRIRLALMLALAMQVAPPPLLADTAGNGTAGDEAAPPETAPGGTAPDDGAADGRSLIEEGARLFLRGLWAEMEPGLGEMLDALEEMRPLIEEWGPRLHELIGMMDDIRNYEPPRMLPNGDIIIRRRTAPDGSGPPPPEPGAEIEL